MSYPSYLTSSPYCKEVVGSHCETFGVNGSTAKVRLLALWSNRFLALPAMGTAHPADPRLRLSGVEINPLVNTNVSAPTGSRINYEYAQIDLTYDTAYIAVGDLPVESCRIAGMMLEIGVGRTWASDHTQSEQPQAIPITTMEYSYRSKFLDAAYSAQKAIVEAKNNTVNSGTFKGKAAGTFLFQGWQSDCYWQYSSGALTRIWDCTYIFSYKADGFNNVWRAQTAAYDSFDQPLYASTDFSTLTV